MIKKLEIVPLIWLVLGYNFRKKMGRLNYSAMPDTNELTCFKACPFFKEYVRKTTVETRYYISSLNLDAKKFGESVRSHWGIENSLHWILDVALNEDDCRIRKDNAPQNFAVLRHIAVNLLGKEKSKKLGIKNKQFLAAMDDKYLAKILELSC